MTNTPQSTDQTSCERPLTLVFGDDASPAADLAWLWINSHQWKGWRLEVVTAQPPPVVIVSSAKSKVRAWEPPSPRQPFARAALATVEHLLAEADPRIVLSRSDGVDLTVIGPRGGGFLKSVGIGSTADWLLSRPPTPLVIARHGRTTQTAVVCADGSPHAERAVEALAKLPWVGRLRITVVSVDDGRTDANASSARAVQQLETTGANLTVEQLTGAPTKALLKHLEGTTPDLVVLGTRGLTGIPRLLVGSTASAIARGTDCNTLVACAHSDLD